MEHEFKSDLMEKKVILKLHLLYLKVLEILFIQVDNNSDSFGFNDLV